MTIYQKIRFIFFEDESYDINIKVVVKNQNNLLNKNSINNIVENANNKNGLSNLCFTCYFNSVIQVLFNIIEFRGS